MSNVVSLPAPSPRWEHEWIVPGEYDARVVGNETRIYFRRSPKLVVWWLVTDMEIVVPAFYAVPGLIGKPRRNGKYQMVGPCSRLYRDLAAMLGRRPDKLDRCTFPVDAVSTSVYAVSVETVTADFEQKDIPEGARYSRVERVL